MQTFFKRALISGFFGFTCLQKTSATEVVTNGDFETGTFSS